MCSVQAPRNCTDVDALSQKAVQGHAMSAVMLTDSLRQKICHRWSEVRRPPKNLVLGVPALCGERLEGLGAFSLLSPSLYFFKLS